MSQPEKAPVPARPASTVVILRDGPDGIETFMVVRHHAIDFASGALVFPGGKVDEQDRAPEWVELAPGTDIAPGRDFRVAAARETFEEAGLLLARRKGGSQLLSADEVRPLVEKFQARVAKGEATFAELIRQQGLEVAIDLMVPFAHWITPTPVPKRFDTHFLLVAAPVSQLGAHDGRESVEGVWIRPADALSDAQAGRRTLVFATSMNLKKLSSYRTVAETVAATKSRPVVTVMPRIEKSPEGRKLHIPAEAGYGVTEVLFDNASIPGA